MLAAVSGFHPRVACRSSDYRFMSALVGRPDVRDLPITPSPPATSAPTPEAIAAKPGRRTTARSTAYSRARDTGEPDRTPLIEADGRTKTVRHAAT
jgi:hypothetical protein